MTDRHRTEVRRIIGGITLLVAPAVALAGWSMFPSLADDDTVWVAHVADGTTRAAASMALVGAGAALSVIAYLTLVHLVRERHPALGEVGGVLAAVGSALSVGIGGLALAEVEVVRAQGESAATVSAVKAVDQSSAALVMWLGPLVAAIGIVVLAFALYRSRTVPQAIAALLGLSAVVQFAGMFLAASVPVVIIGSGGLLLALGAIGILVLTQLDADWEHVPQYQGFRALQIG